jgi:hypothetical protein
MNSTKAWYWVAAGVLALGLNSEYQRGGLQWAHRVVSRGHEVVACAQLTSRRYLAMAKLMFGTDPDPELPSEAVLAQVQESVDGIQNRIAHKHIQIENIERLDEKIQPSMMRAEMAMERAQIKIDMAQMRAEMRSNRAGYLCPRMRKMTFTVPEVPNMRVPRVNIPKIVVRVPQVPEVDLSDVPGISSDDTL